MENSEMKNSDDQLSVVCLNKIIIEIECERKKVLKENRISDAMILEKRRVDAELLRDRIASEGATDELIKQFEYILKEYRNLIKQNKEHNRETSTKISSDRKILLCVLFGILMVSIFIFFMINYSVFKNI